MNFPQLFSNRKFRKASILTGVLGLLYFVINLFVLGGDEFVYNLNSLLVSPLSILTAVMAATLWRGMKTGIQNQLLWGGLLAGWVLWAAAESLWATYSLSGQDPYPSWADLFFLIGYVPMSVGFLSRVWGLPKKQEKSQRVVIWVISLIVISVTTIFILIPILQDYDPERLLESLLSLFYPLADLFLLLLTLNLLFTYGAGDYGSGWRLILFGFITVTFSDLFFSYADWNGLYYPDSNATWISRFAVDVPYIFSYVLWTLGILLREHDLLKIDFQPRLVTNAHVFVFTRKDETVIDVSKNYYRLFPLDEARGRPLAEVLGISNQQESVVHERLLADQKLTDYPIRTASRSGESQECWLCGLAIVNPPNEYSGAMLLIRTFAEEEEIDAGLSEYQESMLPYVLHKCNSSENREVRQFLLDYHLAYIKALFNIAFHEGGAAMSQSLLDEMRTAAQWNGWNLQFNPKTILEDRTSPLDVLREALPRLLETAKQFVSHLTDAVTVETEVQAIHWQFSEAVRRSVWRLIESHKSLGEHAR